MHKLIGSIAVTLPLLLLTACDDFNFGDSERYKEDFHYSFSLPAGGRVSLENFNGSIEISSWEKDTIEINGTKYGNTQQAMKDIKIDITPSANSIQIRTVAPYGVRNVGARYSIRVPRHVELERINSSNGSIRVEDIEGPAHLRSSNGGVRMYRHTGELDVQTSNGGIEVTDHRGNSTLRTTNGGVRVEMNEGALQATTSNGSITARLVKPDANAPVRLESSNGHIELSLDAVREVRASTSNSSIIVRMPSSANARVRAHTSNSSITTDFEVLVRGIQSKNTLEGTLGSGGPLIDVSTSNGSIKLTRL